MNNFFRTLIAGWGAKKLGGGCLSTILIFILIYWALGNCGNSNNHSYNTPKYQNTTGKGQLVVKMPEYKKSISQMEANKMVKYY
ncbi:hypothetical protein BH09BAC2_BH09BAC2_10230 [soil metagenome]